MKGTAEPRLLLGCLLLIYSYQTSEIQRFWLNLTAIQELWLDTGSSPPLTGRVVVDLPEATTHVALKHGRG